MANRIARIVDGRIVYSDIQSAPLTSSETAARESREDQRLRYRKELLQPNEVGYYAAYPDQAENLSPEVRRELS